MRGDVTPPRIRSVPPCTHSLGREAVELGATGGIHLDGWQQADLEDKMGLTSVGKWAAFEGATNVARQNGKNEIALVRELAGLFLLDEQLIIHSAHEFKTSTEHQRRVERVIQDTPEWHKRVKPRGYKHSHGEESIELSSGQRIRFMTRTKGGGRGHTGDLVVLDEAMILPDAMIGALMPTMSARSILGNPQLWYFFTAVDQMLQDHGLVVARLRDRALSGDDPSLAYAEWSVDAATPDDVTAEMAADPEQIRLANPAIGIRISLEHVANERRSMDARTFAVERLGAGDWPATDGSVAGAIDIQVWNDRADPDSEPLDPLVFAFDVEPGRSWSSVAVAGKRADGKEHVEVIQRRRGTGWVAAWVVEKAAKHGVASVLCDAAGPAGSLLPQFADLELEVVAVTAPEHAKACGLIFDLVAQDGVRHLGPDDPSGAALQLAVRGATKRPLGDAWAWSRKNSGVDISPLVAVTLALWGSANAEAEPFFGMAYA